MKHLISFYKKVQVHFRQNRKYGVLCNKKKCYIGFFTSIFLMFILGVGLTICGEKIPVLKKYTHIFSDNGSIFVMVCTVCLFLIYTKRKEYNSRWINQLAATMFGVYLIHDNPIARQIIWGYVFQYGVHNNSQAGLFIVEALSVTIALIFICSIFEGIRIGILEQNILKNKKLKTLFQFVDKYYKLVFNNKKKEENVSE